MSFIIIIALSANSLKIYSSFWLRSLKNREVVKLERLKNHRAATIS